MKKFENTKLRNSQIPNTTFLSSNVLKRNTFQFVSRKSENKFQLRTSILNKTKKVSFAVTLTERSVPSLNLSTNNTNESQSAPNTDRSAARRRFGVLKRQSTIGRTIEAIKTEKITKKAGENLQHKKDQAELIDLKKQRERLGTSIGNTRDAKSMAFISKKVMSINKRMGVLLKKIKNFESAYNYAVNPTEEDDDEDKDSQDANESSSTSEVDQMSEGNIAINRSGKRFNSLKEDSSKIKDVLEIFKMFNNKRKPESDKNVVSRIETKEMKNHLQLHNDIEGLIEKGNKNDKISQILLQCRVIEHKDKQNNNLNPKYTTNHPNYFFMRNKPNALYKPSTDLSQGKNLFTKSYRPKGFKNKDKTENKLNKHPTLNLFPKKNLEEMISDYEIEKDLLKTNRTHRDNPILITDIDLPQPRLKSSKNLPQVDKDKAKKADKAEKIENDLKKIRNTFMTVLRDSQVIKAHINENSEIKQKESEYDELLKLYEGTKDQNYVRYKKNHEIKSYEEQIKDVLAKYPKAIHDEIIKVFTQIDYEDRVLNKQKRNEFSEYEEFADIHKTRLELKKHSQETLSLMRNYVDFTKIGELKKDLTGQYTTIDNLTWLTKKHRILKNMIPLIKKKIDV